MHEETRDITELIIKAAQSAREATSTEPEPELTRPVQWPVQCTVGPGLEGAIACETKVGYVNGSKGWLIYRGYDIFDLCAFSTFEEVSYLLLHGNLPNLQELTAFKRKLAQYRMLPESLRLFMSFPVQEMTPMSALRLGTNLMRQKQTRRDQTDAPPRRSSKIGSDEDSIAMETRPLGGKTAVYEFAEKDINRPKARQAEQGQQEASGLDACCHLIAGLGTLTAAIARLRQGRLPIEPDPELGHAANLLYMMTGRRPTAGEERLMDVALILHADHGMNASTFAAMVVASTLSDVYFSIGAGIGALSGPLHGGANEEVLKVLREIGNEDQVGSWYDHARAEKRKIMGFGHRVYKAYDPRARVLAPLAEFLVGSTEKAEIRELYKVAKRLEDVVVADLGAKKGIFPNVDYYSGIVYSCMDIPADMFTPIFAVSRVSGWSARVLEYLKRNRIFRPRGIYVGGFDRQYVPISER